MCICSRRALVSRRACDVWAAPTESFAPQPRTWQYWRAATRSQLRGLKRCDRAGGFGLALKCRCLASDQLSVTPPIGIDLRQLRAPMMQALDALWKKPRGRFDAWDTNLSLLLSSEPVLTLVRGRNPPKEKIIRDSHAEPVLSQALSIYERSPAVFAPPVSM